MSDKGFEIFTMQILTALSLLRKVFHFKEYIYSSYVIRPKEAQTQTWRYAQQ